jgi:hypothetical protein
MSFIVIFCLKGDTLVASYFEPMKLGYQASTQMKYFGSVILLYIFSIEVYMITDPY